MDEGRNIVIVVVVSHVSIRYEVGDAVNETKRSLSYPKRIAENWFLIFPVIRAANHVIKNVSFGLIITMRSDQIEQPVLLPLSNK